MSSALDDVSHDDMTLTFFDFSLMASQTLQNDVIVSS